MWDSLCWGWEKIKATIQFDLHAEKLSDQVMERQIDKKHIIRNTDRHNDVFIFLFQTWSFKKKRPRKGFFTCRRVYGCEGILIFENKSSTFCKRLSIINLFQCDSQNHCGNTEVHVKVTEIRLSNNKSASADFIFAGLTGCICWCWCLVSSPSYHVPFACFLIFKSCLMYWLPSQRY